MKIELNVDLIVERVPAKFVDLDDIVILNELVWYKVVDAEFVEHVNRGRVVRITIEATDRDSIDTMMRSPDEEITVVRQRVTH